jgi:hypothetical protein
MSASITTPPAISQRSLYETAAATWTAVRNTAQFSMVGLGVAEAVQLAGAWEYAYADFWHKPLPFSLVGTVATAALFVGAMVTASIGESNRRHYIEEAKRNSGV